MKYAVTDYDGCEYITAGKRYEVIRECREFFRIIDDEGDDLQFDKFDTYCKFNWRIEMNNDIEQQGNDFEVKYDPEEIFVKDGEIFNASKHGFKEYATRYIRADLISQKQPEMSKSDVTRSDIELIDYFAGQALQGILSNPDMMMWGVLGGKTKYSHYIPDNVSEMSYRIAAAMMEARKNK